MQNKKCRSKQIRNKQTEWPESFAMKSAFLLKIPKTLGRRIHSALYFHQFQTAHNWWSKIYFFLLNNQVYDTKRNFPISHKDEEKITILIVRYVNECAWHWIVNIKWKRFRKNRKQKTTWKHENIIWWWF
jgi:hypothetical protein